MPNARGLLDALRLGFRQVTRAPGFSAIVILTLSLGIGVNAAIFSVVRSTLLAPLPVDDPDSLVRLRESFSEGAEETQLNLAPLTWKRWRERNRVFADIAVATTASFTVEGASGAEYVPGVMASSNFLSVLGVSPALGRDFHSAPEVNNPVLVSDAFWRRTLKSQSSAIGSTVVIDGETRVVIGVMPKGFRHPYRADLWIPLAEIVSSGAPVGHFLYSVARLKPGIDIETARVSMRVLCAQIASEHPRISMAREARVVPLRDDLVRDSQSRLFAILPASLFVVLIAGANVASLLLARHVRQADETLLRVAFGATRAALIAEVLAHSLVLAILGSAFGVWIAASLTPAIHAMSPMASDAAGDSMRDFDMPVRVDAPVLAATAGLTLLIGLGFGTIPAIRATRDEIPRARGAGARGATRDRTSSRILGGLVVGEIAVATVLLSGTNLMARRYGDLASEPWGFDTENRLVFDVSFSPRLRPAHSERTAYLDEALERLRALPGVRSATASTVDLLMLSRNLASITPEGTTPPEPRGYFITSHRMVVPGYFDDFGIPIVRGRAIDDRDAHGARKVAVVSQRFANTYWPGQDPIGKTIKRGRATDDRPPYTVVGVARDIHAITDPTDGDIPGMWFLAYAQNPGFLADDISFVVQSKLPPETIEKQVRAALREIDPWIAPHDFAPLTQRIEDARAADRFGLGLVGAFGALGLVLAAIGLYGLLSFHVAHRTREFGVRTAVGARAADTARLVFREGGSLVALGLLVGSTAALALSRVAASQVFGLATSDPWFYVTPSLVLTFVAGLACALPARRAARIEPTVALREN